MELLDLFKSRDFRKTYWVAGSFCLLMVCATLQAEAAFQAQETEKDLKLCFTTNNPDLLSYSMKVKPEQIRIISSIDDAQGCDVIIRGSLQGEDVELEVLSFYSKQVLINQRYNAKALGKILYKCDETFRRQRSRYYQQVVAERDEFLRNKEAQRILREEEMRKQQTQVVGAAGVISKGDLQEIVKAAVQDATEAQSKQNRQSEPAQKSSITSDVDLPKYKNTENSNNFAIIIGVEKYGKLPPTQFAGRDAEAVRSHLLALGYPLRNIVFMADQEATRAGIAKTINTWLPNRSNDNSTVFFYYSGHGAPDTMSNQAYLVPIDGDPEDLEDTGYSVKQLYQKLNGLKAKQIIVALDSCFSGAGGRSVLAKDARPLVNKIDTGNLESGKVIAFSASNSDQISGAIEEQGHGAFTYYFLKGLNGEAADKNGSVTVKSLYGYLVPKVEDAARLHNRDQIPQLMPASSGEQVEIRLR